MVQGMSFGASPNGGQPDWLQQQLFAQRAVFLIGMLDDATATRVGA